MSVARVDVEAGPERLLARAAPRRSAAGCRRSRSGCGPRASRCRGRRSPRCGSPPAGADALLDDARVARVETQLALRVGLLEDLAVPRPLRDRDVVLVAAQEQVPERAQQAALGLEARRRRSSARRPPRPRSRPSSSPRSPAARTAAARLRGSPGASRPPARDGAASRSGAALDRLGHFGILRDSLLSTSIQY